MDYGPLEKTASEVSRSIYFILGSFTTYYIISRLKKFKIYGPLEIGSEVSRFIYFIFRFF